MSVKKQSIDDILEQNHYRNIQLTDTLYTNHLYYYTPYYFIPLYVSLHSWSSYNKSSSSLSSVGDIERREEHPVL